MMADTTQGLKESACTPLFWNAFTMRSAGACIHTHSQHAGERSATKWPKSVTDAIVAVMLTLLLPRDAQSFRISHQEMIKGVRKGGSGTTLRFFDTLEVPIIENTADEEDLTSGMAEVRCQIIIAWEEAGLRSQLTLSPGHGKVPRRPGNPGQETWCLRMG